MERKLAAALQCEFFLAISFSRSGVGRPCRNSAPHATLRHDCEHLAFFAQGSLGTAPALEINRAPLCLKFSHHQPGGPHESSASFSEKEVPLGWVGGGPRKESTYHEEAPSFQSDRSLFAASVLTEENQSPRAGHHEAWLALHDEYVALGEWAA